MKNKIIHLLSVIFMFLMSTGSAIFAQNNYKTTALHTFLQKNADSTVVLHYFGATIEPPTYVILSKKADTVTLYVYESPINKLALMPWSIRKMFEKRDIKIMLEKVDANVYFNAKSIEPQKARDLWKQLMSLEPWKLKSDNSGCPNEPFKGGNVLDGSSTCLDLITKDEIRNLIFDIPDFFEWKCPGNKDRQGIIAVEKLFKVYFRLNYNPY